MNLSIGSKSWTEFSTAWIVRAQIHRRASQKAQRLVKTALVRARRVGLAEMPFAKKNCVIVAGLEQLRDRDLARRHRLIRHRRFMTHQLFVEYRLVQTVVGQRNQSFECHRRRRELEAESRREAPCHYCRARRRASRVTRVPLRKRHALMRNRVDMRSRHRAVSNPAAVDRDVVEPQVVGENNDHIRRTLLRRSCRNRGSAVPGHRMIGRDWICDAEYETRNVVPVTLK